MSRPSTNVAAASVSFTKAFVPGLIIGLIIGAFAGAFITPLLDGGSKLPVVDPPRERETGTPETGADND